MHVLPEKKLSGVAYKTSSTPSVQTKKTEKLALQKSQEGD